MNGLSPVETDGVWVWLSFLYLRDATEAYQPCTDEAPPGLPWPVIVFQITSMVNKGQGGEEPPLWWGYMHNKYGSNLQCCSLHKELKEESAKTLRLVYWWLLKVRAKTKVINCVECAELTPGLCFTFSSRSGTEMMNERRYRLTDTSGTTARPDMTPGLLNLYTTFLVFWRQFVEIAFLFQYNNAATAQG